MPKRRTSRVGDVVPSSSSDNGAAVRRRARPAGCWKPPVMRRWTSSVRPLANATIRYLPRRRTASTRSPWSSAATASGDSGRVRRPSRISTRSNVRPTRPGSSCERTVSTSGSSGMARTLPPVEFGLAASGRSRARSGAARAPLVAERVARGAPRRLPRPRPPRRARGPPRAARPPRPGRPASRGTRSRPRGRSRPPCGRRPAPSVQRRDPDPRRGDVLDEPAVRRRQPRARPARPAARRGPGRRPAPRSSAS